MHLALQYVNGSQIFTKDPEEMEKRLVTAISVFQVILLVYEALSEWCMRP